MAQLTDLIPLANNTQEPRAIVESTRRSLEDLRKIEPSGEEAIKELARFGKGNTYEISPTNKKVLATWGLIRSNEDGSITLHESVKNVVEDDQISQGKRTPTRGLRGKSPEQHSSPETEQAHIAQPTGAANSAASKLAAAGDKILDGVKKTLGPVNNMMDKFLGGLLKLAEKTGWEDPNKSQSETERPAGSLSAKKEDMLRENPRGLGTSAFPTAAQGTPSTSRGLRQERAANQR